MAGDINSTPTLNRGETARPLPLTLSLKIPGPVSLGHLVTSDVLDRYHGEPPADQPRVAAPWGHQPL